VANWTVVGEGFKEPVVIDTPADVKNSFCSRWESCPDTASRTDFI
jgi:hypothetical protein